MRNFLLGALVMVLISAAVLAAYLFGQQNSAKGKTAVLTQTLSSPLPSSTAQLVGNDRDEHGCITSAGYVWCEKRQKCLKPWEEGCPAENDASLIKQALFLKNNWIGGDVTLTLKTNDGDYASGSVTGAGGGGYFYAAKVNGAWEIVADGNGAILCSDLSQYPNFPKTLIPECFDLATGQSLQR